MERQAPCCKFIESVKLDLRPAYDCFLKVYISGKALVVLSGPRNLVQTIYVDECEELNAVVIDERSGNIAVCGSDEIYIYKPYGGDEGDLKVSGIE